MFWDNIVEGSVTGLLKGAGQFAKDVRTAITGKEALSSEQQLEVIKMADALETAARDLEQSAADGQIALNRADAESGSIYKGGWRPGIGWVCASGLGYTFLFKPLFTWYTAMVFMLWDVGLVMPALPALDMKELMALTFCLLGFGGMRMYEKVKGTK